MTSDAGFSSVERRKRSWRVVMLVAAVDLLVLGGSGLYLMFRYRPTAAYAWPSVHAGPAASGKPWLLSSAETLHEVSAYLAIVAAVVLVVCVLAASWRRSPARRAVLALSGVALVGGLVVGLLRGARLRWDQLALWAVTTGSTISGVWLSASTKYVIVGRSEVDPNDFRSAVWMHVVVVPAVVALAFGVIAVASSRSRPSEGRSAPPQEPARAALPP